LAGHATWEITSSFYQNKCSRPEGEAILTGKVFVSCGQKEEEEREAADRVCELLKNEFKLTPYVAIRVQSLDDIMIITKELRSSDYFLFIDFNRYSELRPVPKTPS
jgi:hypothetical protein